MFKKSLLSIAITISLPQIALAEQKTNPPKNIYERDLVLYSHSNDYAEQQYQAFINKASLVKNRNVSYFDIIVHSLQIIDDDQKGKESLYNNQELDIKNDEVIIPTKYNCKTNDVTSSKFIYINKETDMIVERPIPLEMIAKPNTAQEKSDMAILKKTVCQ